MIKSRYFSRWNFAEASGEEADVQSSQGVGGSEAIPAASPMDNANSDDGNTDGWLDSGKQLLKDTKAKLNGKFNAFKAKVESMTPEAVRARFQTWVEEEAKKDSTLVSSEYIHDVVECFETIMKSNKHFKMFIAASYQIYDDVSLLQDEAVIAHYVSLYNKACAAVSAASIIGPVEKIGAAYDKVQKSVQFTEQTIKDVCQAEHEISLKVGLGAVLEQFKGLSTASSAADVRGVISITLRAMSFLTIAATVQHEKTDSEVLANAAENLAKAIRTGDKALLADALIAGSCNHSGNKICETKEYSQFKAKMEQIKSSDPELTKFSDTQFCEFVISIKNDNYLGLPTNDRKFNAFKNRVAPACAEYQKVADEVAKHIPNDFEQKVGEIELNIIKDNRTDLTNALVELSEFIGKARPGKGDNLAEAVAVLQNENISKNDAATRLAELIPFCAERGKEDLLAMSKGDFGEIYNENTMARHSADLAKARAKFNKVRTNLGALLIEVGVKLGLDGLTTYGEAITPDNDLVNLVEDFMATKYNDYTATVQSLSSVDRASKLGEYVQEYLDNHNIKDPAKRQALEKMILDKINAAPKSFSRERYADKLENLRRIKIAMRRYYSAPRKSRNFSDCCKNYEDDIGDGPSNESMIDEQDFCGNTTFCGNKTFSKKRRSVNPFGRYYFAADEEEEAEEAPIEEEEEPIEDAEDTEATENTENFEDEGMDGDAGFESDNDADTDDEYYSDEELPEEEEEYDISADEVDGDEEYAEDEADEAESEDMNSPAVCAPRGEDMEIQHWSDSVMDSTIDDEWMKQSEYADQYDSKQGELTLSAANAGEAMAMQNDLATLRGVDQMKGESNFSRTRAARRGNVQVSSKNSVLRGLLGDKYLR